MRGFQPSFASGEITPLLHARVDLARYGTALAWLKNMIVLPQGGVTRRPGMIKAGDSGEKRRLVPFIYNAADSLLLEFGDRSFTAWSGGVRKWTLTNANLFPEDAVAGMRYVQSGNVLILTHRGYPPVMVTRDPGSDQPWTVELFEAEGGPWIEGEVLKPGREVWVDLTMGSGDNWVLASNAAGTFESWMVGSKVKLEYAVSGGSEEIEASPSTAWHRSSAHEVKSSFNVNTTSSGKWAGTLVIERRTGYMGNWMTLREFLRTDSEKEGQIDFTVSETEPNVFYRVRYQITEGSVKISVSSQDFVKSFIFQITSVIEYGKTAMAKWIRDDDENHNLPEDGDATILGWWLGAWGNERGYPAACAFYQDRLVFAGSDLQPGTVWMSRVGSYKDFSVSDPLEDDDAITITLTTRTADGIHSLVAASDLLAFTASGEWKIAGAGDAGAISPTAIVAHQQSCVGSKSLQPIDTGGRIIFVQTHGRKVYALGYDLNTDGYMGSELSILSPHLFEGDGREIVSMAWQQIPDGLLWFVLEDGTAATCTYNPEHETVGWARQETAGQFTDMECIPGDGQTELWAEVLRGSARTLERFAPRVKESLFSDNGTAFESGMKTLRVTWDGEGGSAFDAKKLISRVVISTLRTSEAWVAPGFGRDNWDRRRRARWNAYSQIEEADVQLDSGFAADAAVEIRDAGGPLTVLAISPVITPGA